MGFTTHIGNAIDGIWVQQNVLRMMGGGTWGSESNILRVTHKALLESVVSYGFVAVGSGAYEKDLRRLDTCALNLAVRATTGAIVLLAMAGTISAHNLYIQHCARSMDLALCAYGSNIARGLQRRRSAGNSVQNWTAAQTEVHLDPKPQERVYSKGFRDVRLREKWAVNLPPQLPTVGANLSVPRIYYTSAKEAEENARLKHRTYDFRGAHSWTEVATQALRRVGWRPGSVVPQPQNIRKVLPPIDPQERIIIGTRSHMIDTPLGKENPSCAAWLNGQPGGLHVTAGAFFQKGLGYSATWERAPDGHIRTHGWILRHDKWSTQPPQSAPEGSILHALRRVESFPHDASSLGIKYNLAQAGALDSLDIFRKWTTQGALEIVGCI